jgi:hypothetical protein
MPSTKSNSEKLLVKPGDSLMVVNPPPELRDLIEPLPRGVMLRTYGQGNSSVILFFARNAREMKDKLSGLRSLTEPEGIIWIAYLKGTSTTPTDINRDSIRAYAGTIDLEAVAMVSLNEDWSAMRLKPSPRVTGKQQLH